MSRGRKPGFRMSNEHRVKIQNSNILNALIEHAEGKREMSPTQVSAGLGLLRKVLPDLAASADAGEDGDLDLRPARVELVPLVENADGTDSAPT
ncbi:MAG: hypothetical protein ACTHKQ_25725 [Mesorhizobium sp.]